MKVLNEILNPPNIAASDAVHTLLFNQFGNYVLQQSLEVAKDPQYSLLIEHVKPYIHDLVRNVHAEETPTGGNLANEHVRRLAMKLVKKYPALSEGLEAEQLSSGAWNPYAVNPYAAMGMAPYMPPFDPTSMGSYMGYPATPFPAMPYGYSPMAYPGYPGMA